MHLSAGFNTRKRTKVRRLYGRALVGKAGRWVQEWTMQL
jgi:hypothetical protein